MARPSKPIPTTTATTIKFLCSYGGKILPRYPDGKLRYYGGETRVLAVDRSISFSDLLVKLGELSGTPVALRCQLPTEDLDALISITCDEDLANLIEEYGPSTKIRAFLITLNKKSSPPPSTAEMRSPLRSDNNCVRKVVPEKRMLRCGKSGGNLLRYACENSSLVNIGNQNFHFLPLLLTQPYTPLPTTTSSQPPPTSHSPTATIQAAGNPHPAADHHHPSRCLHHLSSHKRSQSTVPRHKNRNRF
uniref:PB1 domain-containing protein n=1 Tax=Tanacetum cinerariifolium TaxID=118510 RepID=A0A6L2JH39_TANCI|nr:hypothetical protein [Tanacetum cinerariifolium]